MQLAIGFLKIWLFLAYLFLFILILVFVIKGFGLGKAVVLCILWLLLQSSDWCFGFNINHFLGYRPVLTAILKEICTGLVILLTKPSRLILCAIIKSYSDMILYTLLPILTCHIAKQWDPLRCFNKSFRWDQLLSLYAIYQQSET